MKTLYVSFLAIVVSSCSIMDPVRPGINLYVYGDSISYGDYSYQIATELHVNLLNYSYGGTSLLRSNYSGQSSQASIIAGETWESGSIILWSPGVNDCVLNLDDKPYQDIYYATLLIMMSKMSKATNCEFFIGTPIHTADEDRFYKNAYLDKYADLNRHAVKTMHAKNIHLVDFCSNFTPSFDKSLSVAENMTNDSVTTVDGLHPNDIGNKVLSSYFLSYYGSYRK